MDDKRQISDLDVPNENVVVCKDIEDILTDLKIPLVERELYKDVIQTLEKTMYEGFQEGLCVAIPYVCRIMKNAGKKSLSKNRKELFGNDNAKLAILNQLYRKPFDDAKEKQLEEKRKNDMKKKNKFKFNIGIETKLKVTDYNFRKNYVKPGTFQFVNKNGKTNT